MKTSTSGVAISPVNMSERATLGLRVGDTVRVHQKIQDKGKTRIQIFEGLVLARKHGTEPGATFTVRKVASGVGVEKIYPLYSPLIDKLEIVKRAKVRRAKLYYIREKVAREIKRQIRRMSVVDIATESEAEASARQALEDKAREEAERKATEELAAAAAVAEEVAPVETADTPAAEEAPAAEVAEETPAPEVAEAESVEEAPTPAEKKD